MTEKEAIEEILRMRGWTKTRLQKALGYERLSNVTSLLGHNKNGIRTDILFNMLDAMGFEIVLRDKMGTKTELVVDMKPKPKLDSLD